MNVTVADLEAAKILAHLLVSLDILLTGKALIQYIVIWFSLQSYPNLAILHKRAAFYHKVERGRKVGVSPFTKNQPNV